MSDFRPCSTCASRSQAPLCHCARGTISNRAEGTLERLRYLLGGDRPSQTTRLPLSAASWGRALEQADLKSGISPAAPPGPRPRVHGVPPMLRMGTACSIVSYSKAPWGLSV